MGVIQTVLPILFGTQSNVLRETAEVFRENAEAAANRSQEVQLSALSQMAAEFAQPKVGVFDRVVDGLNRLPRPLLALGTLGLLSSAMIDPVWFAARMQGIALVPEPLWWLLGVIVTFYFGARHQAKGQDFQRNLAETLARVPQVLSNLKALDTYSEVTIKDLTQVTRAETNPALAQWKAAQRG
ncbi:holin family protein [Epibacterium ulvae]|uniref:holin family protein n=1 Tax=Epibacterium ulvae TaxID=1156985 RepID=UPI001BFBFBDB|nr:holin family protein [Epibacterium ulvae]MBT8152463.1 holin family protein [Epibacterium ulvae]